MRNRHFESGEPMFDEEIALTLQNGLKRHTINQFAACFGIQC